MLSPYNRPNAPQPPMQQNPAVALAQSLDGGTGFMDALRQVASMGQRQAQIVGMIQGKSAQELQTFAQNLAKEYNVDLNSLLQQMGVNAR